VAVIGRAGLGLKLAAGGWFHKSDIGECSSGGNVLRRRIKERRSLSRNASSDMKMPVGRVAGGQQGQVIHIKGEWRRRMNGDGCARVGDVVGWRSDSRSPLFPEKQNI
jgi:hypothetical protein